MTLARLVEQFPPETVAVISEHPANFAGVHNALVPVNVLHRQVRACPLWCGFFLPGSMRRRLRTKLKHKAVAHMQVIIQQFKPTHLVAVYPTQGMLEATRKASTYHGLPWLPYFFDNPKAEELDSLQDESCLLALTEGVQYELQSQVRGKVHLAPHVASLPKNLPSKAEARELISKNLGIDLTRVPLIAHTGAVEQLQIDGLKDLVHCVQYWPGVSPIVILSSPSPNEARYALRELGAPAFLHVLNLLPAEVILLQRAADALFATVPLSGPALTFGKTCFPTKILDYLTVGTPIVVRGPEDSTLCRHANERGYAVTVCEAGPKALRFAMSDILNNTYRQACLLQHAEAALSAFSGESVARQLISTLEIARPAKA